MVIDAILLGAGSGKRFGVASQNPSVPKQFQTIRGIPIFIHSMKSLLRLGNIRQMWVAVPKNQIDFAQSALRTHFTPDVFDRINVIEGGARRQDSAQNCIDKMVSPFPTRVLVHDACRPYLSDVFLTRLKKHLLDRSYGAWIPVVPTIDTLKRIEKNQVIETLERGQIYRVQTPQIFEFVLIRSLYEKLRDLSDKTFTDDASLCEYSGIPVGVFEGEEENIKLTFPFEKEILAGLIQTREVRGKDKCEQELVTTYTS